jgi:spore maturation protein SpmA
MSWILSHVPTSFLLGAIAGPLAMIIFQNLKKIGGWIDAQPTWAKQAWLFVFTQVMAIIATVTQTDVSCAASQTATDCLAVLTPAILKGLIMQVGAIVSFKLKQAKPFK